MNRRALAAALVTAAVLGTAGCGSDTSAGDQEPASGPTRHHGSPSGPSSPSSSAPADQVTVPVYFVGQTPQGPRLYREFRRVDAADPLGAALTLAASGEALDPDYGTVLPAGSFRTSGDAAIPLPDDSWQKLPAGMAEADAQLAIQQLVYTAQGVLQSRDPITFTDADGNPTQIFYTASEDGFRAADPIKTLALVSVTTPESNATVSGSFTASGVSSSFEATTPWEIRDASDQVVKKGSATAEGWMDKLYPWQTEIDVSGLEPGVYTFVAMTDDPSGGEGGGPTVDTKTIIVK
ncbi:Gmad2 immunoglobulin-like domain-containing protein [Nocardioides sp.]|uniref:Gmad2 immunoglobulin-like domain-containing protein n=1 Tax=Nocardioides sp. TaxID=35761 RepID=UPI003784A378